MRTGDTASQAMGIDRAHNRASRLGQWRDAADDAELTATERRRLWHRQFLNPAIDYDDWG